MNATVTRWQSPQRPEAQALLTKLRASGRDYATWGNAPGDTYALHSHTYRKHLVCLRGSITFDLPASSEEIELRPGDELDLPAGTAHSAEVGQNGVQCAEAHLPA